MSSSEVRSRITSIRASSRRAACRAGCGASYLAISSLGVACGARVRLLSPTSDPYRASRTVRAVDAAVAAAAPALRNGSM